MRVGWVIVCRYAEVDQAGFATIVGAGVEAVGAVLPAKVGVQVVIRIEGRPDDAEHQLEMTLHDPSMAEVVKLTGPFRLGRRPGAPEADGWETSANVTAALVIDAQVPGAYSITASVDGGNSKTVAFRILNAEPA